jgi:lysine/ornithine N-monooxygenase
MMNKPKCKSIQNDGKQKLPHDYCADKHSVPDISGLLEFRGQLVHTAAWGSTDLRNKKVAVIGNGSSAAQLVPALYLGMV